MCQQLNCCSPVPFRSKNHSSAQVCRQTREVLQPWDTSRSPGACATHTCCSHMLWTGGPSTALASSLPMGWGQDQPLCCALQLLLVLNCFSPLLPFLCLSFFFYSSQRCSSCNPGASKQALPSLFNCRKHQWRWLRLHSGCIRADGSEAAGWLQAVGVEGLQEHWTWSTVSLQCFWLSPVQRQQLLHAALWDFRRFFHKFFCLAEWQEVILPHNLPNQAVCSG